TTVPPGFSVPLRSASNRVQFPPRSFPEPHGFMNAALPKIPQPVSSLRRRRRIRGVLPIEPVKPSLIFISTNLSDSALKTVILEKRVPGLAGEFEWNRCQGCDPTRPLVAET